jgi:hypothetical protein
MLCNGRQGTAILPAATDIDAAAVLFNGNVVNQEIDFTFIDPFPATRYRDLPISLPFMGYGEDNNGTTGVLRVGTGRVGVVNQNYTVNGGTGRGSFVSDAVNGAVTDGGDSGGRLWGLSLYPLAVAGVVSAGNGVPFGTSYFAQAADFRHAVRTFIADNVNPGLSLMFDNTADLNNFTQVQGTTGTAPSWSISGGNLVQSANAPRPCSSRRASSRTSSSRPSSTRPTTTPSASSSATSTSTTSTVARPTSRTTRSSYPAPRQLGGRLASVTWNGTFSTVMQAIANEKKISCKIGASVTTGEITSTTFPIGRVGIYDHFNKGAKWGHWGAGQWAPVAATW